MTGVCSASPRHRSTLLDIEKEIVHTSFRTSGKAYDVGKVLRPTHIAKLHCLKERGVSRHRRRPVLETVGSQLSEKVRAGPLSEVTPKTPLVQKTPSFNRIPGRPAASPPSLPQRIPVSPQALPNVQQSDALSQGAVVPPAVPGGRPLLKVRARRTLDLQADSSTFSDGRKPTSLGRQNRCARSAGDIHLGRARVQQASRAAFTRSAEWPAVSCIRKRTEETTGYELPSKSFKQAAESQSWQAAAACLAKLTVQDRRNRVKFGETTIIGE